MVFHASEFFLVLSLLLKVFLYSLAGDVLQSLLGAKTVRASYDLACIVVGKFNKLTSVFHASVLLLIMNFVITLSK